jgi:DnaJ-class molecular chaperone
LNPYTVLGVERDADTATIKKAFRKAALKFHPDQNPGDPDAERSFKEVARAWEILGDEERRRDYDQTGKTGFGESSSGSGFWHDVDFERAVDSMEALFADVLADLLKPRS